MGCQILYLRGAWIGEMHVLQRPNGFIIQSGKITVQ